MRVVDLGMNSKAVNPGETNCILDIGEVAQDALVVATHLSVL
jgi:hypothetical protein